MKRAALFTLLLAIVIGAGSTRLALAQRDATPSAAPEVAFTLPTVEQVPEGMVIISDGDRTLDDVASGFSDPVATIEQFVAWGWQGNVIRAFHIAGEGEADPREIDGIYISVHQFGTPEFAAEALDYSVDEHLLDPAIEEVAGDRLGDYSRMLSGDMAYGREITWYVQRGTLVIRLSASSPEGDPAGDATRLTQAMLDAQPATPVAA
ncbi:MAG: hypothetical protein WKF63_10450 [Thermomicrobiales bacterium]